MKLTAAILSLYAAEASAEGSTCHAIKSAYQVICGIRKLCAPCRRAAHDITHSFSKPRLLFPGVAALPTPGAFTQRPRCPSFTDFRVLQLEPGGGDQLCYQRLAAAADGGRQPVCGRAPVRRCAR